MGLIERVLGVAPAARAVGETVTGVAEVFVGNRAERDAAEHAQFSAAVAQYGAEFATVRESRFDAFMNGLNRLPRPILVLGTVGLFVYAMLDPAAFSLRMQGLALVPEPLWWLLGAIVSFYFGARELHYRRGPVPAFVAPAAAVATRVAETRDAGGTVVTEIETAEATTTTAAATEAAARAPAFLFAAAAAAPATVPGRAADPDYNAALEDWRRLRA
jgi:hypothetical protein